MTAQAAPGSLQLILALPQQDATPPTSSRARTNSASRSSGSVTVSTTAGTAVTRRGAVSTLGWGAAMAPQCPFGPMSQGTLEVAKDL